MKDRGMNYPYRGRGPVRALGKDVQFDEKERRWVSRPIHVHAGTRKAARA